MDAEQNKATSDDWTKIPVNCAECGVQFLRVVRYQKYCAEHRHLAGAVIRPMEASSSNTKLDLIDEALATGLNWIGAYDADVEEMSSSTEEAIALARQSHHKAIEALAELRRSSETFHVDPTGTTREPPHCPTCGCGIACKHPVVIGVGNTSGEMYGTCQACGKVVHDNRASMKASEHRCTCGLFTLPAGIARTSVGTSMHRLDGPCHQVELAKANSATEVKP